VVVSKAIVVSGALEVAKLVTRVVSLVRSVKAVVVVSAAEVSMKGAVVVSDAELSVKGRIVFNVVAEAVSEAESDRVSVKAVLVLALTLVSVSMAAKAVVIEELPGLHSPAAAMPAKTGRVSSW
jgi:tetrahydromethanopterin S-methyltransferase subunit H